MILKKHKNSLLGTISASGLDSILFSSVDGVIDKEEFFIIQLRESTLRFAVRPFAQFNRFQYYCSTFTPGFPLAGPYGYYDTESLHIKFNEWLDSVVKPYLDESSTPDLWQTLEDTWSETISEIDTTDYLEPFSEEEKTRINLAIDKFQVLLVNNFNPNKEALYDINNSLKYLSDASESQSKFQWKILALSVVLNIAFNLALDPEKFQQLIQLFKQVFSNIIYLLP